MKQSITALFSARLSPRPRLFSLLPLLLLAVLALATPLFITPAWAASQGASGGNIVLSLPESALAEAMAAMTPFSFKAASQVIQGTITVRAIDHLRLDNNQVRARLDLLGNNLEVVTELAGQKLRMKVGEVALAADVLAELRFSGKRRILYIKPVVDPAQNAEGDEVGRSLVALLNGREFPVSMKDIEPFVAEVGGKTITIATTVADIRALPNKLELSLTPKISSRAGK